MTLRKVLKISMLFIAFGFLLTINGKAQKKNNCEDLKVRVIVTEAKSGNSTNSIQVLSEAQGQDLRINLLSTGKNSETNDRLDAKANEVMIIKSGEYDLIITDWKNKNACPLHQKIKVD